MNSYIAENGKSSMGAVVEQIQQTYDLQVSGYYRQLQLVEEFLLHERELSLEVRIPQPTAAGCSIHSPEDHRCV